MPKPYFVFPEKTFNTGDFMHKSEQGSAAGWVKSKNINKAVVPPVADI